MYKLDDFPGHQAVMERFVAACQTDERVVAATLYGSHARKAADPFSDLDLGLITTDVAYDDFVAGREAFIRLLGDPVFLEDFDIPNMVFVVFRNGVEVELSLGHESRISHSHGGSYRVLLDKKNILAGAAFPRHVPTQEEQVETLRRLVNWFWHDLSHFIAAMGRGQLWWAQGQLEVLRRLCVNLARLRQDFSDPDVGEEGYFKLEQAVPVATLSALEATFCPMEPRAMLEAALVEVRFYRDLALPLAQEHGLRYPADLDQVIGARLENLCNSR